MGDGCSRDNCPACDLDTCGHACHGAEHWVWPYGWLPIDAEFAARVLR